MTFLFCFCNHNCALPVLIEAYFLLILFGIYDDLTKDHVPGLQKYDICMTEQVSGSRRVKIEGRHLAMVPYLLIVLYCFGLLEKTSSERKFRLYFQCQRLLLPPSNSSCLRPSDLHFASLVHLYSSVDLHDFLFFFSTVRCYL